MDTFESRPYVGRNFLGRDETKRNQPVHKCKDLKKKCGREEEADEFETAEVS